MGKGRQKGKVAVMLTPPMARIWIIERGHPSPHLINDQSASRTQPIAGHYFTYDNREN